MRPLAEDLGAEIVLPLDVNEDGQFAALFDEIRAHWGRIDICVHSIAFCRREDLHGRVTDVSRAGFAEAMDISVGSFIRMVHQAEPLMRDGGTCMTVSYLGGEKVVDNYNVMGPVKAALESVTRYMADGPGRGSRPHAQAGHHRRCRRLCRLPGQRRGAQRDRRTAFHRRRLSHHGLNGQSAPARLSGGG